MSNSKPIPTIQSAYLCIQTAKSDCNTALYKHEQGMWADAHMWVENAISQLMSAKYKLWMYYLEQEEASK